MADWGPKGLTAAKLSDGRMQLWAADVSGRIWSTRRLDFGWSYWESSWSGSLPAFSCQTMAVAPLPDKRLQFWAVDSQGLIWSCNQLTKDPDSSWTGWTTQWTPQPPPFSAEQVAVAPLSDKRLRVWALDTGGRIWSCAKATTDPNAPWTEWTTQWTASPPFTATQIAVAPWADKRLQFWAIDGQGVIWSCVQTGKEPDSPWASWVYQWTKDLPPFSVARAVAAAPLDDGRLRFWAVDQQGTIWSCRQSSNDSKPDWQDWTAKWLADMPTFVTQALWPARLDSGHMQVWVVDNQGQLRTTSQYEDGVDAPWANWNLVFSMMKQEQTDWCWSATATATSHFYDPPSDWTQCLLVNAELGKTTCCEDPKPCNKYGYLGTALKQVGHFKSSMTEIPTQEEITQQAQMGLPVGLRVAWSLGGAHFIMVAGGGANDMVTIKDSWYGSSFVNYHGLRHYRGAGSLTNSYYTEP